MTLHDKMDSKKSDEEIDDSEEDENDSALDSSASYATHEILYENLPNVEETDLTASTNEPDMELRSFIHKCSGGFLFFYNKDTTNYEPVTELLKRVETLVAINGKSCYTLSFYPASERKIRKKMEKILEKRKENIAQQERDLVIYCKTEQELERKKRELWRTEEDDARKKAGNPAKQKMSISLAKHHPSGQKSST
ncbi:hypothetical protein G5714_003125 [Onychostoma macrolepis]|uniref:Uncharacterized protein n=1 Tax=Onychostoma macrolepis TaxID=369639 RepID=A0A7J6D8L0_9TELE|nr:hypothetical protein G5714_003125 [Onychostoma macrolepis]